MIIIYPNRNNSLVNFLLSQATLTHSGSRKSKKKKESSLIPTDKDGISKTRR
jgi:hypothetical protein